MKGGKSTNFMKERKRKHEAEIQEDDTTHNTRKP